VTRAPKGVLEEIGKCWELSLGERKIEKAAKRVRGAFKKSRLFSRL
jgi:hypothetical protein